MLTPVLASSALCTVAAAAACLASGGADPQVAAGVPADSANSAQSAQVDTGEDAARTPDRREPNTPRLGFSFNKARGLTGEEWSALTQYADLVLGLDGHGYDFPGLLDDFRAARPDVPLYCFVTAMAMQRQDINDWRFKRLDHDETAFLHVGDPASFKAVIVNGKTRLFWVRDYRISPSSGYPNPPGVTSYQIESAPAKDGPWTGEGQPMPENGTAYYEARTSAADPNRWYRLRSRLADTGEYAAYSWPTRPDAAAVGFTYMKVAQDLTFTAGIWGEGPQNPSSVVLEWGRAGQWGYASIATAKGPTVDGVTEYTGRVTRYPSSGHWVIRLRDTSRNVTSMMFEPARRNNRLIDRFGAHFFKPDHPLGLSVHKGRLAEAEALGLAGMRLDFVVDSYPTWLAPAAPVGEDAAWADIEPRTIAMLDELKAAYPRMKLVLNGISVTSHYTGIYDFLPHADGADCEYIGWSSPNATEPFRDADMLDGVIGVAHVRQRPVTGYSYAAADNIDARITSIARYWLIFTPHVYYHYQTADAHQSVDYFPEYDIDMGHPVRPLLASRADLIDGGIYRREYTRGTACYNPGSSPVLVNFASPRYVVRLHGGRSPKQGGGGYFQYEGPATSTVLAGKRGALVLKAEGDLNCDGVVDDGDREAFTLALSDPQEYARLYPNCNRSLADCNGDAEYDADDAAAFAELLGQ